MQELAPGSRYGSFQIVAKIGRGLTGTVYRAVYQKDGSDVALKFLEQRDESIKSYFFNEMGLLRRAKEHGRNHQHLVEYVASYTTQEPFCLATRFYEGGRELSELLDEGVPPGLALRIVEQVAGALDYLHYGHPDKPVVHRDVKPANIMVNAAGNALLIDLSAGRHPGFMRENERGLGTPQYMPPEQYHGDEQPQTDQFALAMVTYQMLTGRALLGAHADRDQKQMSALRDSGYAKVRTGLRNMPATAEVLVRALAFEWKLRYDSCEELAINLRRALSSDGVALDASASLQSPARRGQWFGYVAMGLVALVALFFLFANPFSAAGQAPVLTPPTPLAPTATLTQAETTAPGIRPPEANAPQVGPTSSLEPTTTPSNGSSGAALGSGQVRPATAGCALRNIPSTDGTIIRYNAQSRLIPSSVALSVLGQRGDWYNVQLPDGRSGWCPDYQLALKP